MPEPRGFEIPDPREDAQFARRKNYLLAIGIDAYQHVGKLSNAVRDAQMVGNLLEERYGFEDKQLLFDEQATRRGIRNILRDQIDRVGEGDNLVIYFSGHGHYDKRLGDAYWVPVDARFGDDTDYISYDFIRRSVAAMRAHHIFLIVDSCYSGAVMVRKREEALKRFEKDPSRWMLASGRNEVVPDGISGKNSPFATQLIDVLTRYSGEGIRVSELVNKVTTAVIHDSFQTPIGRPLFQVGDKGGEFVFRAKLDEEGLWRQLRRENSVRAYTQYLAAYPAGKFVEQAEWARAELLGTVEAYLSYRNQYVGGSYYAEALKRIEALEEEADWKHASNRNSIAAYEGYRGRYPSGKYRKEADQRIENLLKREKGKTPKAPTQIPKKKEQTVQVADKAPIDGLRWAKWGLGGLVALLFLVWGIPRMLDSFQISEDRPTMPQDSPANITISYDRPRAKALTREEALAEIDHFMKRIPGGDFDMGSNDYSDEKPVHLVRVSSFSISQFEVTQAQWAAIMGENPSNFKNCPNCPGGASLMG